MCKKISNLLFIQGWVFFANYGVRQVLKQAGIIWISAPATSFNE